MRKRLSLIPLILALLVLTGLPTAASADYRKVYTDCADGNIDGSYTAKELQQALRNLEGNLSDYSDCADAIVRAQNGGPAKKHKGGSTTSGGGGSGGGTGTTGGTTGSTVDPTSLGAARTAPPAEVAEAAAAATTAATKATHDGAVDLEDIQIPASALQMGASGAALPLPLLLALIACAAAACLAGGATGLQALRRRRGR